MSSEEVIIEALKRPITITDEEISQRRQLVQEVIYEKGGGIIDEQTTRVIQLFITGRISKAELSELLGVIASEVEVPKE